MFVPLLDASATSKVILTVVSMLSGECLKVNGS